MAIDTTFTSGNPYFDDWSTSGNASKNYLKILFQPGRSVQARELNQIQSGIQEQIDRIGNHIFVDGTRVLDGEIDIDNTLQWVDIDLTADAEAQAIQASKPLVGKIIYADAGGATYSGAPANVDVAAEILDYELRSESGIFQYKISS